LAGRSGQRRSTAARAASTGPDRICVNGRVTVRHSSTEAELAELRSRCGPGGITSAHPVPVDRARGSELWDVSGKRYVDFASGIGVMNVGHAHPRVRQAVQEQLERATHTSFQVVHYESYLRLAERLCEVAPIDGAKKAIFFSTGAEAIENAVKIARAATGRPAVISFRGGFHGRTLLALSLTGSVQPYKQDFGPYATEIYQTPFPYAYRGWTTEAAMADLENLLESEVSPKRVAAIVIEPVLGEGGFVPAPLDFMRKLREVCDRYGLLLIGDVRVVGAMAGMELVRDRGTKEPADKETAKIIATAREKGLIILRCGVHHNVIRTLMPLTIPDELLEEGLDMLGASLGAQGGSM